MVLSTHTHMHASTTTHTLTHTDTDTRGYFEFVLFVRTVVYGDDGDDDDDDDVIVDVTDVPLCKCAVSLCRVRTTEYLFYDWHSICRVSVIVCCCVLMWWCLLLTGYVLRSYELFFFSKWFDVVVAFDGWCACRVLVLCMCRASCIRTTTTQLYFVLCCVWQCVCDYAFAIWFAHRCITRTCTTYYIEQFFLLFSLFLCCCFLPRIMRESNDILLLSIHSFAAQISKIR